MSTQQSQTPVVLSLGANQGDRAATLRSAVNVLSEADGLLVSAVSEVVETDPVGGPAQPDYLNAVCLGWTSLAPQVLLDLCQRIEAEHGLDRATKLHWGPRPLDIDVITYGEQVSGAPGDRLVLPHPRAHLRAFVLAPWHTIDSRAVLPGPHGGPVADLLSVLDTGGVRVPDPAVSLR